MQQQSKKPPTFDVFNTDFTMNLKSWSDFWAGGDFIFSERRHFLQCSIVICLPRSSSKFHLKLLSCNSVADIVAGNIKCACGPVVQNLVCLSSTYILPLIQKSLETMTKIAHLCNILYLCLPTKQLPTPVNLDYLKNFYSSIIFVHFPHMEKFSIQ